VLKSVSVTFYKLLMCDILSRHSIKIYYNRVNYQEVFNNLRKKNKYKEFIKHCQVEFNMMIDVIIMT